MMRFVWAALFAVGFGTALGEASREAWRLIEWLP